VSEDGDSSTHAGSPSGRRSDRGYSTKVVECAYIGSPPLGERAAVACHLFAHDPALVTRLLDRWRASEAAASVIVAQEKSLLSFGSSSSASTTPARVCCTDRGNRGTQAAKQRPRARIAAAGQLVMLTQRLGRSANSMITGETESRNRAHAWRDISLFRDLTAGTACRRDTLRISSRRGQ